MVIESQFTLSCYYNFLDDIPNQVKYQVETFSGMI